MDGGRCTNPSGSHCSSDGGRDRVEMVPDRRHDPNFVRPSVRPTNCYPSDRMTHKVPEWFVQQPRRKRGVSRRLLQATAVAALFRPRQARRRAHAWLPERLAKQQPAGHGPGRSGLSQTYKPRAPDPRRESPVRLRAGAGRRAPPALQVANTRVRSNAPKTPASVGSRYSARPSSKRPEFDPNQQHWEGAVPRPTRLQGARGRAVIPWPEHCGLGTLGVSSLPSAGYQWR